jgi:hypothetical protein
MERDGIDRNGNETSHWPSREECTIPVVKSRASPIMTDVGINDVGWVIIGGHGNDLMG